MAKYFISQTLTKTLYSIDPGLFSFTLLNRRSLKVDLTKPKKLTQKHSGSIKITHYIYNITI